MFEIKNSNRCFSSCIAFFEKKTVKSSLITLAALLAIGCSIAGSLHLAGTLSLNSISQGGAIGIIAAGAIVLCVALALLCRCRNAKPQLQPKKAEFQPPPPPEERPATHTEAKVEKPETAENPAEIIHPIPVLERPSESTLFLQDIEDVHDTAQVLEIRQFLLPKEYEMITRVEAPFLPDELWLLLLGSMDRKTLSTMSQTCKFFNNLSRDPWLFKHLEICHSLVDKISFINCKVMLPAKLAPLFFKRGEKLVAKQLLSAALLATEGHKSLNGFLEIAQNQSLCGESKEVVLKTLQIAKNTLETDPDYHLEHQQDYLAFLVNNGFLEKTRPHLESFILRRLGTSNWESWPVISLILENIYEKDQAYAVEILGKVPRSAALLPHLILMYHSWNIPQERDALMSTQLKQNLILAAKLFFEMDMHSQALIHTRTILEGLHTDPQSYSSLKSIQTLGNLLDLLFIASTLDSNLIDEAIAIFQANIELIQDNYFYGEPIQNKFILNLIKANQYAKIEKLQILHKDPSFIYKKILHYLFIRDPSSIPLDQLSISNLKSLIKKLLKAEEIASAVTLFHYFVKITSKPNTTNFDYGIIESVFLQIVKYFLNKMEIESAVDLIAKNISYFPEKALICARLSGLFAEYGVFEQFKSLTRLSLRFFHETHEQLHSIKIDHVFFEISKALMAWEAWLAKSAPTEKGIFSCLRAAAWRKRFNDTVALNQV